MGLIARRYLTLSVGLAIAGVCIWWLDKKKRSESHKPTQELTEDVSFETTKCCDDVDLEDAANPTTLKTLLDMSLSDRIAPIRAEDSALLPCNYKVWLKTFGCSHNSADSETMSEPTCHASSSLAVSHV